MDAAREGETRQESSTEMLTRPRVRQAAGGERPYNTGASLGLSDDPGWGDGQRFRSEGV